MGSKTEEFAMSNMTSSMGRAEASEQQRLMRQTVDDKLMRDIVNDFRTYSPTLPAPKDPTALATPAGAGVAVDAGPGHRWGWVDSPGLNRTDWAGMSEVERRARDEEWARNAESRKQAEKQVKDDQSKD
jgi:hypothetical protein